MVALDAFDFVFLAGLLTAFATGIGTLPFFVLDSISDRGNVALWGFAAGAMIYLVATEFIPEALETGADLPRDGKPVLVAGIALGVALMVPLAFI